MQNSTYGIETRAVVEHTNPFVAESSFLNKLGGGGGVGGDGSSNQLLVLLCDDDDNNGREKISDEAQRRISLFDITRHREHIANPTTSLSSSPPLLRRSTIAGFGGGGSSSDDVHGFSPSLLQRLGGNSRQSDDEATSFLRPCSDDERPTPHAFDDASYPVMKPLPKPTGTGSRLFAHHNHHLHWQRRPSTESTASHSNSVDQDVVCNKNKSSYLVSVTSHDNRGASGGGRRHHSQHGVGVHRRSQGAIQLDPTTQKDLLASSIEQCAPPGSAATPSSSLPQRRKSFVKLLSTASATPPTSSSHLPLQRRNSSVELMATAASCGLMTTAATRTMTACGGGRRRYSDPMMTSTLSSAVGIMVQLPAPCRRFSYKEAEEIAGEVLLMVDSNAIQEQVRRGSGVSAFSDDGSGGASRRISSSMSQAQSFAGPTSMAEAGGNLLVSAEPYSFHDGPLGEGSGGGRSPSSLQSQQQNQPRRRFSYEEVQDIAVEICFEAATEVAGLALRRGSSSSLPPRRRTSLPTHRPSLPGRRRMSLSARRRSSAASLDGVAEAGGANRRRSSRRRSSAASLRESIENFVSKLNLEEETEAAHPSRRRSSADSLTENLDDDSQKDEAVVYDANGDSPARLFKEDPRFEVVDGMITLSSVRRDSGLSVL